VAGRDGVSDRPRKVAEKTQGEGKAAEKSERDRQSAPENQPSKRTLAFGSTNCAIRDPRAEGSQGRVRQAAVNAKQHL
jgi:hypothetical protein